MPLLLCRLQSYPNLHPIQEQNERHDPETQTKSSCLRADHQGGGGEKCHTPQKLITTVLPVLHVLLETEHKYVDDKQRVVSHALPHPEHQQRCLSENVLQPEKRADALGLLYWAIKQ